MIYIIVFLLLLNLLNFLQRLHVDEDNKKK